MKIIILVKKLKLLNNDYYIILLVKFNFTIFELKITKKILIKYIDNNINEICVIFSLY